MRITMELALTLIAVSPALSDCIELHRRKSTIVIVSVI